MFARIAILSLFSSPVFAADAAPNAQQGGFMSLLPLVIIFVIFYFLLIRPQAKRAKEHRALVAALAKGDEVVTTGGLAGRVTEVGDAFLTVEVADTVAVKVQRQAVTSVLPKGTLKGA